jgi:plasmid stability protein
VAPDTVVNFTIRVHAEARKKLRIRSAESDASIEEIVRGILYPALGLKHLPVTLDSIPA